MKLLTSPSNLERLFLCRGSGALEEKIPSSGSSSPEAERGKRLHKALELKMKGQPVSDPEQAIVDKGEELLLNLFNEIAEEDWEMLIEQKLSLAELGFDHSAQIDYLLLSPDKTKAVIVDFKSGQWGHEADSWQMRAYALAVWKHYGVLSFTLAIVQPEIEIPVKRFPVELEEVMGWLDDVEKVLEEARLEGAPFTPSPDACRFCRALHSCPAYKDNDVLRKSLALPAVFNSTMTMPEYVRSLTNEGRKELWEAILKTLDWAASTAALLETLAGIGHEVKGWSLRPAKNDKAWTDDVAAAAFLKSIAGERAFEAPKLLSPAKALEMFKDSKEHKETLNALINLKPSKKVLKKEK